MIPALAVLVLGLLGLVVFVWRCRAEEFRDDRIPALLYHRFVSKEAVESGRVVCTERTYVGFDTDFAAEMQALHDQGYTTLHMGELMEILGGERPRPRRPIVVTFDDGFRSVHEHAFPVLRRLGMKAVFFVTPDPNSENFRKNAPLDAPVTPDEMRSLSAAGVEIQSHAQTHRYLTDLDETEVRWELAESRRVLEEIVGRPVRYLAIPSGAYNRTIRRLARETGYAAVFGMGKGTVHPGSDPFALRRLVVGRGLGASGLARLLRPETAFHLRLSSAVQETILRVAGPRGLDGLRAGLLRLPFGALLLRRPLRLAAAGLGALLLLGLLAAAASLLL